MSNYGKVDSQLHDSLPKFWFEFSSLPKLLRCENEDIQQISSEESHVLFKRRIIKFKFTLFSDGKNGFFKAEFSPKPIKIQYSYTPNEMKIIPGSNLRWRESKRYEITSGWKIFSNKIMPADLEKMFQRGGTLYAEIDITSFKLTPEKPKLGERLMELWKDEASMKFNIKCGDKEFEVLKPIMFASSPVLKAMFDSAAFTESINNCVTITNFKPNIVEKMIEFCMTDNIEYGIDNDKEEIDFDNETDYEKVLKEKKSKLAKLAKLEDDIFKIAHFYQINGLLNFIITRMKISTYLSNAEKRLKMAKFYENQELEDWCLNFVTALLQIVKHKN